MFTECELQDRLVIQFEGRMDTAKCTHIEVEMLQKISNPGKSIVFDIKKVDFISSAFIRLCIFAYKQAGEYGFQIINVDPSIKKVFKIAGLDSMLQDESSRE